MTTSKKTAAPKKVGRPSLFSEELADKIIQLIEDGFSERQISKMEGMPSAVTIWKWKDENQEFLKRSARARQISAEKFDDKRRECAEWLVQEAEMRANTGEPFPKGVVEAMKAAMQEHARSAALRDDSRFGDRKKVALTGEDGGPIQTETTVKVELTQKQREILDKVLDEEY